MPLNFIQVQKLSLDGSGCTSTATSITLKSFSFVGGTSVTMADVGSVGFMTLDPSTSREEQITFTGLTQNANGTATITGVIRGKRGAFPYDLVAALRQPHSGGSVAVMSNTAAFYGNISAYADSLAIAGAPDASLTGKGIVETATTAQIDAGTTNGETGANLSVRPDQLAASIYATRLPSASEKTALATLAGLAVVTGSVFSYAGRTSPTGYLLCDGAAVSRATFASLFAVIAPSGVFTVTIATPAVFSRTAHGLVAGDRVHISTTGGFPSGLTANTDFFVISAGLTADAFQLALTPAGAAIITTGSQSGVHTVFASAFGRGDGSTTFNVPDLRSRMPLGIAATAPTQTLTFEGAQRVSNDITILDTTFPSQGQLVRLTTTGALPTGLSLATDYFIIRESATIIAFATSQANANDGTKITLSGDGSGVNTMTFTNRTHTILGRMGGEENHSINVTELASHSHTVGASTSSSTINANNVRGTDASPSASPVTSFIGGNAAHNNMSPFIVMNYIIKT